MGADMQYAQELARRGWIADHENVIHEVELEGSAVCRPRIVQYVRVVGVGHAPLDPHLVVEHVEQFVRIARVTPVEPFQIALGFG